MGKSNKYEYVCNLPHILEPDAPHLVTFNTIDHFSLPEPARDIVFKHCLHDHLKRLFMHAFVVMPTHVHLMFTLLRDANEYESTIFYIIEDPVAAGLVKDPNDYKWLWVNSAQPEEAVPHQYRVVKR